jgi:2-dehydro-3-deoxyphosphogluconate aldolase / (4S)-4-hydroxy-2-oxoglutarate aldolase
VSAVAPGSVAARLAEAGVVAVLRAPSAEGAVRAGVALAAGGIRAVEITFSTPGAAEAVAALREAEPSLLVGAGTVTDAHQLQAVAAAGAEFAVSPHTDGQLVAAAREHGLLYLPGALTPTEVVHAAALSPVVKLFPASLGGPGYLKALRAPLPGVQIVPTGGVDASNLGEWLDAGALAVGAGGELCPGALVASGDFGAITERAAGFAAALAAHRERRA